MSGGLNDILAALLLGFVEGMTEFIPVSSTGHLIILTDILGIHSPGHVLEVFIQLGAILAVVVLYARRFFGTITGLRRDPVARRFATNLIVATFPAMVAGVLFHAYIKSLYQPDFIAMTLIGGGFALLALDQQFRKPKIHSVDDISRRKAFSIGCFQMIALIPGISRSGATIMGALALGLSRRTAAEFSFFMAVPVMCAAVAYDAYKNWDAILAYDGLHILGIAFVTAFLTALVVLRLALDIVSKFGFMPFAIYRIAFGTAILLFL